MDDIELYLDGIELCNSLMADLGLKNEKYDINFQKEL